MRIVSIEFEDDDMFGWSGSIALLDVVLWLLIFENGVRVEFRIDWLDVMLYWDSRA